MSPSPPLSDFLAVLDPAVDALESRWLRDNFHELLSEWLELPGTRDSFQDWVGDKFNRTCRRDINTEADEAYDRLQEALP